MKQLQVNLLFSASTENAKKNINDLGVLLDKISNKKIGLDADPMAKASQTARELQVHLEKAVNVDTGKLNLNKLNASLKQSGQSLSTLSSNLRAAGADGQQAFVKLAYAISAAEKPVISLSSKMSAFATTLANTAKWQISSSIIHGVQGALQDAVGHARDLNSALNDIRIVTGFSVDEMRDFTKVAQEAANALGSTTTEYSKASLIFFQQGLTGEAVTQRADVVTKLANVTGQTAQEVSDQMTAIWNNFDDGTKSLEYYADGLTKLGAATAASTDEISQGLEKFAAVADTVGLSYETAAAAVATVVDKTRQSADVVGTAFKTIFARMEGLQLGETLDDGTTLNKYSEALASVGVNIKNQSGELRNMDDILDDLGNKWQDLSKDQQIALAQTVAGVRQYNQFISLMSNWDAVEMNVTLAEDAEGELQAQQDIWAESWEAAAKRIENSANAVYEKIINDEAIIDMMNMFADLIDSVGNFIDAFGGIGPMLLTLGGLFSRQLFPIIQNGFTKLKNNLDIITGKAARDVTKMQTEMAAEMDKALSSSGMTEGMRQQIELAKQLADKKRELELSTKNMSIAEQEEAHSRMAVYEAMASQVQKQLEVKAALEEELRLQRQLMDNSENRTAMASKMVADRYRAEHEDELDTDFIVEEALTTSASDTRKKIRSIQDTRTKQQEESEISVVEAESQFKTANTDYLNAEKKRADAINHGVDTEGLEYKKLNEEVEQAKRIVEERKKIFEEQKQSAEQQEEAANNEERRLKKILELQRDITKEKSKSIEDMSLGKISSDTFIDQSFGYGPEDYDPEEAKSSIAMFQQDMAQKATAEAGISIDEETGAASIEATIGNYTKVYEVIGQYQARVVELNTITNEYSNTLGKANQEVADAQKEYDALEKAGQDTTKAEERLKKATEAQEKALADYSKALKDSKKQLLDLAKESGASEKSLTKLTKAFDALENEEQDSEQAINNIIEEIQSLKSAGISTVDSLENIAEAMFDAFGGANMNPEQLILLKQKLQELGFSATDAENKIKMFQQSQKNAGGSTLSFSNRLQNGLTAFTSIAGAAQGVYSGIKQITSAFQEGNSPMETFMGVLSGMAMITGSVTSAVQALTAAKKEEEGATKKQTLTEALSVIGKNVSKVATDGLKKAEEAHGIKRVWLTVKTLALAAAEAIKSAVQTFGVAGVAVGIAAAAALTAGYIALTSSIGDNTQAMVNNQNTANGLSEAYTKAKEAADELRESISNYQEALSGLEELQKGTEEYTNKLKEANEQAMALIETYGLWNDYRINADSGAIEITASGYEKLEQIQKEKDEVVTRASQNAIAGQLLVERENFIDKRDKIYSDSANSSAFKKDNYSYDSASDTYKKLDKDEIEEMIGLMSSSGIDFSNLSDSQFEAAMRSIEGMDVYVNQVGDSLVDMKDKLIAASVATAEYTNSMEGAKQVLSIEIQENFTGDIKKAFGNDVSESTIEAISNIVAASSEERTGYSEKLATELDNANIANLSQGDRNSLAIADNYGGSLTYEQLTKEYAKLQGISEEELENAHFTDRDWQGSLKTASGEVLLSELYYDEMVRALKTAEITQQVTDETSEQDAAAQQQQIAALGVVANKLDGLTDGLGDAVLTSMTQGKTDSYTYTSTTVDKNGNVVEEKKEGKTYSLDLSSTFGNFSSQEEVDQLLEMDSSQLIEYLGMTEKMVTQAGFDSAGAFERAFDEGMSQWDLGKYEAALQAQVDSIFSQAASEGLNEDVLRVQAEMLEKSVDGLEGNEKAAAQLAVANQKLNKGVKKLSEGWEDWSDALKNSDKESQDYAEAVVGVSEAMKEMLNFSDETLIPTEFFENQENLDLLEAVTEGSEEALQQLKWNLAETMISSQEYTGAIGENIRGMFNGAAFDEETAKGLFDQIKTNLESTVASMKETIQGLDPTEPFTGANAVKFAVALNSYAEATGMTVAQMQDYLSQMDLEAEITTKEVTTQTRVPKYTTVEEVRTIPTDDPNVTTTEKTSHTYQSGFETVDQTTEVAQVNMGELGVEPKITKLAPATAGGGITSSSTTGGDSGGSKSSPAKKIDKTKKEDLVERYKEVNDDLDDVSDAYDRVSAAADRAFGTKKLKLMQQQREELKKQKALLEARRKEEEAYLKTDREAVNKAAREAGLSFTYDSKGNIENYESEMTRLWNQLNAAQEHMNTAFSTQEAQDEYKEAVVTPLEETIEALKDAMAQYEETREQMEDTDTEIIELQYQIDDSELEELEYEVELKIDVADDAIEFFEYLIDKLEDASFMAAEKIALTGKLIEENFDKATAQTYLIDEILKRRMTDDEISRFKNGEMSYAQLAADYGFTDAEIQDLRDASSELLDINTELRELQMQVHETYSEVFEDATEEIERASSKLEHHTAIMENYNDIIDTVGKKTLGVSSELQSSIGDTVVKSAQANIKMAQAQLEVSKTALADAQAQYEAAVAAGDHDLIAYWKDFIKDTEDAIMESEEMILDYLSEGLQAAADNFERTIENITNDAKNAFLKNSGFASWELFENAFSKQQELNELYLQDYEKTYEISKLMRSINKDIDSTDNLKAQKEYNKLLEEVNGYNADNVKMSEYDVAYLQKKYELLQAQIALEEAQNAKNQVRLRQDSEGNWGYVYTADQNQVADAEQNYEDKLYELQNQMYETENALQEQYMSEISAMFDEISNLQATDFASWEEYLAAVQDIINQYSISLDFCTNEITKMLFNNNEINKQYGTDLNEVYADLVIAQMLNVETISEQVGIQDGIVSDYIQKAKDAYIDYQTNVQETLDTAKIPIDKFSSHVDTKVKETNKDISSIGNSAATMQKTLTDELGKATTAITNFSKAYKNEIDKVTKANEAAVKSINVLVAAQAGIDKTGTYGDSSNKDKNSTSSSNTSSNKNTNSSSSNSSLSGSLPKWDRVKAVYDAINAGRWGNGAERWKNGKAAGYTDAELNAGQQIINYYYPTYLQGMGYTWEQTKDKMIKDKVVQMLTGGYTGDWEGSEGKLAILHKKELILNARDTENMLQMLKESRSYEETFDKMKKNQIEYNAIMNKMYSDIEATAFELQNSLVRTQSELMPSSLIDRLTTSNHQEALQQEVTIHAEFPNAVDHNEIERAFEDIVNLATQYANRY